MLSRRALLAAVPAGVAAACAPRSDDAMLSLWAMSYEGDYSPMLMPAFTRATGITVDVQSLPWTAAHEKLLTAFAGGSLPDVFMLPNGWVSEFAMIGAIAPVTDAALLADQFPSVRDTIRYGGRDFAVPWSVGAQMQFYRSDLVEEAGYAAPPTRWTEWRQMGEAVKRRHPDRYAVLAYLNWYDTLFTFAGQTGEPLLRERDTRGNFSTPAFREALAFYKSLFDLGLAPRALSTEIQDPLAAFARGYFAIYPSAPTLLLDLRRRQAEIPRARWDVMRMPGPDGPGLVSGGSASLAVSTGTTRPREAWALLRYLTSPTSELRYQYLIGSLPARLEAWRAPQLATPLLAPFEAQMRAPAWTTPIIEWERIRLDVQLIAERTVRGALTVDEAVRAMDTHVDALLAKRRALVQAGRIA